MAKLNFNFSEESGLYISEELSAVKSSINFQVQYEDAPGGSLRVESSINPDNGWYFRTGEIVRGDRFNISVDNISSAEKVRIVCASKPVSIDYSYYSPVGGGTATEEDIAELRDAINGQATINAEQQKQIDRNTEVNEQQEKDIIDNTMIADPAQVDNLFK